MATLSLFSVSLHKLGIKHELEITCGAGCKCGRKAAFISFDRDHLQNVKDQLLKLRESGGACADAHALLSKLCVVDHNSGRVVIDKDSLAFYLEWTPEGKKNPCRFVLKPMNYNLFRDATRNNRIYFDEFDLLGQRVSHIPVRRVIIKNKFAWIQSDRPIPTHPYWQDIAHFY